MRHRAAVPRRHGVTERKRKESEDFSVIAVPLGLIMMGVYCYIFI